MEGPNKKKQRRGEWSVADEQQPSSHGLPLPVELIGHTFGFLTDHPRNLARCALVCWAWAEVVGSNSDALWRQALRPFLRRWPVDHQHLEGVGWKAKLKRHMELYWRTTPPGPSDISRISPELLGLGAPCIRLHPRRIEDGTVAPRKDASKWAGEFLWPSNEPWPKCEQFYKDHDADDDDETCGVAVPVLQLRKDDLAGVVTFPEGKDLFQLLWCPTIHDDSYTVRIVHYWRSIQEVERINAQVPTGQPLHPLPKEYPRCGTVPAPCWLSPELVTDYPPVHDLPPALGAAVRSYNWPTVTGRRRHILRSAMDEDEDWSIYSAAPGLKVGGFVDYIQSTWGRNPHCCGEPMQHLLHIPSWERGSGLPRWLPLPDRARFLAEEDKFGDESSVIVTPLKIMLGDAGSIYVHTCAKGCGNIDWLYQTS